MSQPDFIRDLLVESGLLDEYVGIDEPLVAELLAEAYHLSGQLQRLATEKDDTFRLRTDAGDYLVKVSSPHERPDDVDFQVSLMTFLESVAPQLPVQRIQRTSSGRTSLAVNHPSAPGDRVMRVMQFVPGTMLIDDGAAADRLAAAGRALGRLDGALAGFDHPRSSRLLVWDLSHFHLLADFAQHVADPHRRYIATQIFELFRANVAPRITDLDTQVIHGDYSGHNVVVDSAAPGYVTGIIDFGDSVRAPVIFDPAVAMSNLLGLDPTDPWAHACAFLRGYHRARPLAAVEAPLLVESALARLTLRPVMAAWRAERSAERRDYILAHAQDDWTRLEATLTKTLDAGREAVAAATAAGSPGTSQAALAQAKPNKGAHVRPIDANSIKTRRSYHQEEVS